MQQDRIPEVVILGSDAAEIVRHSFLQQLSRQPLLCFSRLGISQARLQLAVIDTCLERCFSEGN